MEERKNKKFIQFSIDIKISLDDLWMEQRNLWFVLLFSLFSRSSGLNERIFVDFLFIVQPPFFSHFVSSAIFDVCVCACVRVHDRRSLSLFFAVVVIFLVLLSLLAVLGRQLPSLSSLSLCTYVLRYSCLKKKHTALFFLFVGFFCLFLFFCTLITDCDEMIFE
jgi:hypothetical protein